MNQHKINTAKLYADVTVENNIPKKLVFYERDKYDQVVKSWTSKLALDYKVEDGVIEYPYQKLQKENISEDTIANLEVPLYNTALYFFNHPMIQEEELNLLEENIMSLYNKYRDNFEEYIENTFAFVEIEQGKHFYSAYLIKELIETFQMLDCLNQKDLECDKRFVLKMQ